MNNASAAQHQTQRRAIGIIRVSEVGGRSGNSFASPAVQRERIEEACRRDGLRLIQTFEELDISGGKSLDQRPGLSQAVAAVEDGAAEVVVAAYFDRLFRSLRTQAEVVERIEAVGGQVLAVDVGGVTNGSAAQWLSGTMHGMMAEYFRRQIGEKSGAAQARAVARGAVPFPIPPGYQRRADKTAEPNPVTAPIVVRAFQMRAEKSSMPVIRRYLAENGISVSLGGLTRLLSNRFYLGELHYRRDGVVSNLTAHEPIIDRDLFERVQRTKGMRGRTSKSPRLLARLGVLRCGRCGGRMSVSHKGNQGRREPIAFYRCTSGNCVAPRTTIAAEIAERVVSDAVRAALRDAQGRASIAESAQEAAGRLSTAQEALDLALRVFSLTGAENESGAIERIAELKRERDEAQSALDQIQPQRTRTVALDADWDSLSLDGQRELVRVTVASAIVGPGRGAARIAVRFVGEQPSGLAA